MMALNNFPSSRRALNYLGRRRRRRRLQNVAFVSRPPPHEEKKCVANFCCHNSCSRNASSPSSSHARKAITNECHAENTQCDQMARLFFDIGPYITMEIRPKAYQFTEDGIKFCKILLDLLEIAQRF